MKLAPFLALPGLATTASAAVLSFTDPATTVIPDGDSSGVGRSLVVTTGGLNLVGVEVELNVSAAAASSAYLGDLYFYLTNGTEAAILMNRAGRRAAELAGYSDNQSMGVTFSATALQDIHNYRIPVTGSNSTPLAAALTGIWAPDGRMVDPGSVLDTDARTAGLDIFAGDAADGTWSLFAADLSSGAVHQINGWTLHVDVVPEPSSFVLAIGGAALLLRRRRA